MTTALSPEQFDLFSQIVLEPDNRSPEKTSSTNASAKVRNVVVRELLTVEDVIDVLELGKQMVQDVDLNEYVEDDAVIKSCMKVRMDTERKYVNVFIAYEGERPIGFTVGTTSPAFHRRGIVAEQKLWYVGKTSRGSQAARKLSQAYEHWARLNGATQIFTGTANKRYAEKTSKMLERLGYARVGALHVKEI